MRKLLMKTAAGIVLAGVLTVQAQAQTNSNNNFTTGFSPKTIKMVPIDTSKAMRISNKSNTLSTSASNTKAFSLSNMMPHINLPGVGNTSRLSNSSLNRSPLMQK